MSLEILNRVESTVTEVTYTIQDKSTTLYYKEWLNESGKVIDALLRDKDGQEIDDPLLFEQIEELVDTQYP